MTGRVFMRLSRIQKYILSAAIVIAVVFGVGLGPVKADEGIKIAPARLQIILGEDDSGTAVVYITSGFSGQLAIGTEDLPFRVEPESIAINDTDVNKKVELVLYATSGLEEREYRGKLTFLTRTGSNVAYGIKLNITITVGPDQSDGRGILGFISDNYLVIILIIAVMAALAVGVIIGRKYRKKSVDTSPLASHTRKESDA
jgi:hypothetical protein